MEPNTTFSFWLVLILLSSAGSLFSLLSKLSEQTLISGCYHLHWNFNPAKVQGIISISLLLVAGIYVIPLLTRENAPRPQEREWPLSRFVPSDDLSPTEHNALDTIEHYKKTFGNEYASKLTEMVRATRKELGEAQYRELYKYIFRKFEDESSSLASPLPGTPTTGIAKPTPP